MASHARTGLFLFAAMFVVLAFAAQADAAQGVLVGRYSSGAYNLQKSRIRYFAIRVQGTLRDARAEAEKASRHVNEKSKTHEQLGDGNFREHALGNGEILVIGYIDVDTREYAWMACDRWGTLLDNTGWQGNTKNEWCRRSWAFSSGDPVYLQFGAFRDKVQYQFNRQ